MVLHARTCSSDLDDYAWHRHDPLRSHSRGMALSAVPKLNVDVCKRTASTDTANGGCMLGSVRAPRGTILLAQMDLACCRLSTGLTMSGLCRPDLADSSPIPLSRVRVCSMRKSGKEGQRRARQAPVDAGQDVSHIQGRRKDSKVRGLTQQCLAAEETWSLSSQGLNSFGRWQSR